MKTTTKIAILITDLGLSKPLQSFILFIIFSGQPFIMATQSYKIYYG